MTEQTPMNPDRLAELRAEIALGNIGSAVDELLADRDRLAAVAKQADEREQWLRAQIKVLEADRDGLASKLRRAIERANNSDAEAKRLRAEASEFRKGCRVSTRDVVRGGITRAHVEAWLARDGWVRQRDDSWQRGMASLHLGIGMGDAINTIAGLHERGYGARWEIFDEIAAMEVSNG